MMPRPERASGLSDEAMDAALEAWAIRGERARI
jgi:hypothetical protein